MPDLLRMEVIMGRKDLGEKNLLSYPDVFSDVINVLLFHNERKVRAEDLTEADPRSQYIEDQTAAYHEQERDCLKYWVQNSEIRAQFGVENESKAEADMPLRVIGYDGGSYRGQLLYGTGERYPVITLVLHYDYKRRWRCARTLRGRVKPEAGLMDFVPDYPMRVYEIAYFDRETVDLFTSDFWFVADFYWQMRVKKAYEPPERRMDHPEAVMRLLSVLMEDGRFLAAAEKLKETGGEHNMCEFIDMLEARGEARGENKLGNLIMFLYRDGRLEEIPRAASEAAYREELYRRYGMEDPQADGSR